MGPEEGGLGKTVRALLKLGARYSAVPHLPSRNVLLKTLLDERAIRDSDVELTNISWEIRFLLVAPEVGILGSWLNSWTGAGPWSRPPTPDRTYKFRCNFHRWGAVPVASIVNLPAYRCGRQRCGHPGPESPAVDPVRTGEAE